MKFLMTSAGLNAQEQRAIVQVGSYESIKAKIDRGINRQSEGRKEVQEGLREMLETKAYLKKYKTIAAFAEHEYGKSARWIAHMLEELMPSTPVNKPKPAEPPKPANTSNQSASSEVNSSSSSSTTTSTAAPAAPATPPKPEPTKDASGYPIPDPLVKTWERRQEVQDLMTLASKLKCAIESVYQKADPLFRGGVLNSQAHIATLNAIHYQLSQCKPGVLCPECDGSLKDDQGRECKECRLTGFISETEWHQKYEKSTTSFLIEKVQQRHAATRLSN